jgi:hypothetical protein
LAPWTLQTNWIVLMTKHVAVLMGGLSAEREVLLRSGEACAKALETQGYQVTRLDVDRAIAETLAPRRCSPRPHKRESEPTGI